MKRLVLVDGNALLHRAYHATPPLSTKKGELVNAVYGFSLMLLKSLDDLKPDFIAIAWDEKGPTFRHQAYTQYKATRAPADDGLSSQYSRVHQVVEALNIPEFKLLGYEADDLIGTLALQAGIKEKNMEIIILTGDRDIMQIINQNIKILMPKKTISDIGLYGKKEFIEKFGFEPKFLVDYKALAGDQSDNIPGVAGIGEVSAKKLISQFGTIERIYDKKNLKNFPERIQMLLAEGSESAVMSKSLATLDLNSPIKLDLAKCRVQDYDHQKAIDLFQELEFRSLINRLPGNSTVILNPSTTLSTGTLRVNSAKDMSKLYSSAPPASGLATPHSDTLQSKFTTDLDLEVEKVLAKMSQKGVLIDLECLEKLGKELKKRLKELEQSIYSKSDKEFNINSPKQLSEILYDQLNLPVFKKTKTGRSTDEGTLQELLDHHPIISLLLEYRQLFKLVSTYIDALPRYIGKDGRIHSTFNVEGAATGRLSSQNPNLQNIPIKGNLGSEIRKAFIAPKGKILLGADYSQIELRIMAHLADDPGLKKAFKEGLDIHSATASKIFKTPIQSVSRTQRTVGKTMNFATLYGQGPRALSKQLNIKYEIAKSYIEDYFLQFPKVKEWMQKTLEKGYSDGYVETLWGRKRYIPELQASNKALKAFGERAAINHPVQGTSADMIKKAMVEIDKEIQNSKFKIQNCFLILQIHDELLFECSGSVSSPQVQNIAKMIKEKMENSLKLDVPVVVDLKIGKNWGEMERLEV